MIDWSGFITALLASLVGGYVGGRLQRRNDAAQIQAALDLAERWKAIAVIYTDTLESAKATYTAWRQLALEARRHVNPKSTDAN